MIDSLSPKKQAKTPKNKTPKATPEVKSVKFEKSTSLFGKKKFAKTPHSIKTHHVASSDEELDTSITPVIEQKKRKLSFSEEDDNDAVSPQSPKKSKFTTEEIADIIKPSVATSRKAAKKERVSDDVIARDKTINTVFVGNLPTNVSKTELKRMFSKIGPVTAVRLRCANLTPQAKNRKAGTILKQIEPGSALSAYVKFVNIKDAKAALRMNGKVLKGHHMRVDMVDPKAKAETYDKNKAVFVRNLPYDLTDDELWAAFQSCGEITSVRHMKTAPSYRGRGLGYVNFAKAESVELALKMHGTEIKDKAVIVQRWGTRIDEPEGKTKKDKKKKADFDGGDDEGQVPSSKKLKKNKKGKNVGGADFSGNIAVEKKKKQMKRLGQDGLKKKKLAKILAN